MCCDRERSVLKEYYQDSTNKPQFKKEARDLHTNLLGACGVANSYRTHTARLLAGETLEHAEQVQQVWEKRRQEASTFITRHRISPPSN